MFESLEELDKYENDDEPNLEVILKNSDRAIFNAIATKIYWTIPRDKLENDYRNIRGIHPIRDDPYLVELVRKHGDKFSNFKNVKFRIETIPKKYKNYYHVIWDELLEDEVIDINYSRYYYDLNENRKRLNKLLN